mmetsp:Transcript_75525/g.104474  ORF Transcript_75525/g.104474 Transcript_75525/m.104474 type:complete len:703 (+) Transcript_75525:4618-6726(+)
MGNPVYPPEVTTKVAVVNFTVKESGLEEQCLGIIVRSEQPTLEQSKNTVVEKIASGRQKIRELEDDILRRLNESKTSLLEDVDLIAALQSSKDTADDVKSGLEQAESTMKRINETRETFRSCGKMAAILFFVLDSLKNVNPMYQFSLEWYTDLFQKSIKDSNDAIGMSQDRMKAIAKVHTLNVYKSACRSLFERHKLLLALQMCVKLQQGEPDNEFNHNEWQFFLKGGSGMGKSTVKPHIEWLTQPAWDAIVELEKQVPEPFTGLPQAVTMNPKEWNRWFSSMKPEPELAQLPGEWETKCEDRLRKMIVLRCFRPDRVNFAIKDYISFYMGKSNEFTTSKPTQLTEIFEESIPASMPIIFVLSPGVDPMDQLQKFAEKQGREVDLISLGRGQNKRAKENLNQGAELGKWIFLANCHLSLGLLPELESMMDSLFNSKTPVNEKFRMFMSANPHEKFPISLLQRSLKVTMEPPRGIKANMLRLYDNMGSNFTEVERERDYRKAIYGLCWFHAILIERKKFKTLGWNVSYAFNDSDFNVCADLLAIYMGRMREGVHIDGSYEKSLKVPWTAVQYLLAEANYGGRVTDDLDRTLIKIYAKDIFDEDLIASENWRPKGTDEYHYHYPSIENTGKQIDASLYDPQFFYSEINAAMDNTDQPVAFGQHINAEITSQIMDSKELLGSILGLMPSSVDGSSGGSGGSSISD